MNRKSVADFVTNIPDFPEEGVLFRDVTTVIGSAEGFKLAVDELAALVSDIEFDVIAGTESRGFIFGTPLAYVLGKPFLPVRKKGKLPRETVQKTDDLEYGTATIEIHKDDLKAGQRVVLIDDLIATGGTAKAAAELIEELGGEVVRIAFLIELKGLCGREALAKYDVKSVVQYEGK